MVDLQDIALQLYALCRRKQRYGRLAEDPAVVAKLIHAAEQTASRYTSEHGVNMGRVLQLQSAQPLVVYVSGLVAYLRNNDRTGRCRSLLEDAVKREPRLLGAWLLLSNCCWEAGDLGQALNCVTQGLRLAGAAAGGLTQEPAAAAAAAAGMLQELAGAAAAAVGPDMAEKGDKAAAAAGSSQLLLPPATAAAAANESESEAAAATGTCNAAIAAAAPHSASLVLDTSVRGAGGPRSAEWEEGTPAAVSRKSPHGAEAVLGAAAAPTRASPASPCPVPQGPAQQTVIHQACTVKEGLQLLSMMVRQQQQQGQQQQQQGQQQQGASGAAPSEQLTETLLLSRDLATAALEMDLSDAYSWYVLALVQLSAYLQLPGPPAAKALQQLLGSFHQAERHGLSDLADLYYNRAALHTYCQAFSEALHDYERAAVLDPSLPVAIQVDSLVSLLTQLGNLVATRGGVKAKHWARVMAVLVKEAAKDRPSGPKGLPHHPKGLPLVGLPGLAKGRNQGHALLCHPLAAISPSLNASATLYLVCADSSGSCLALALVGPPSGALSMSQTITVVHPELLNVRVHCHGQDVAFPLVRADGWETLMVDGGPVAW